MNKLLTRIATATLLSLSPLAMALAAECETAPVTRASDIAAAINLDGHAAPVVVFQRGTAKLAPASRQQLAELAQLLDDEADLAIQVGFAVDGTVSPELAQARGNAVREALLDLSAPADRVAVREVKTEAEIAKVEVADGPQHCTALVGQPSG